MIRIVRCGKRYGLRRTRSCARPVGHSGPHRVSATVADLRRLLHVGHS